MHVLLIVSVTMCQLQGTPEKCGVIGYYRLLSIELCVLSIELYVMQNLHTITMVTRLVAMEIPAHAQCVPGPFFSSS